MPSGNTSQRLAVAYQTSDTLAGTGEQGFFRAEIRDDTLVLRGDTMRIDTVFRKGKVVRIDTVYTSLNRTLSIFLTGNEKIEANNASLVLASGNYYSNLDLQLNFSQLEAKQYYRTEYYSNIKDPVNVGKLKVDATDNSRIDFDWKGEVDSLSVSLEDFYYYKNLRARVNRGVIYYSDSSGVNMQGHQLRNVNLIYRKAKAEGRR